jgi:predicted dehydrogenase
LKKINFGIIGCGYIGTRHAKHIVANPSANLIAAFDINESQAKIFNQHFSSCRIETSINDLVSSHNIDIVNVCTPNGLHYEHALAVLNAGKHVIIEKPITLKAKDAKHLIDVANQHDRKIFVVKQNRYNAPVQALKKLIDENKLGKVFMITINCFWNRNDDYYKRSDWKGKKDLDGGTLFTQFSHFVDIFYYLFGDISNICGIITNANHIGLIEFEDSGVFSFTFKNGAIGSLSYTTTSFEKNMEGSITVFAENATIKLGGQYLNKLEYQRTAGFDITNLPEEGPANDYGYYQGSMSNHDKVIQNVVETLNGKGEIMTSAADGMHVTDIIERMYNIAKRV